jgi:hypothetical protein
LITFVIVVPKLGSWRYEERGRILVETGLPGVLILVKIEPDLFVLLILLRICFIEGTRMLIAVMFMKIHGGVCVEYFGCGQTTGIFGVA